MDEQLQRLSSPFMMAAGFAMFSMIEPKRHYTVSTGPRKTISRTERESRKSKKKIAQQSKKRNRK